MAQADKEVSDHGLTLVVEEFQAYFQRVARLYLVAVYPQLTPLEPFSHPCVGIMCSSLIETFWTLHAVEDIVHIITTVDGAR